MGFKKGSIPWNYSRIEKVCQECFSVYLVSPSEDKNSKYCSSKCRAIGVDKSKMDEKNPTWKGDAVGKVALHGWVKRRLGYPDTCDHCGKIGLSGNKIHWANKSGKYLRDLTDWIRLCVSCHLKYDGTAIKKGQHLSPKTEFKKGVYVGFGFKKGSIPWNKKV